MRVRLTDAADGAVYLESPYHDWEPVREVFKAAIPYGGRTWEADVKKWRVGALYVSDLLALLSQWGAQVQDDRAPRPAGEGAVPMPDDLRAAFEALHLRPTAPLCVAESSFKALVKYYHPNKGGDVEDFHRVNKAMQVIKTYLDPQEEPDDELPF